MRVSIFFKVGTARCELLVLEIKCLRCETKATVSLSGRYAGEEVSRQRCVKCAVITTTAFRPSIVHESSATLGFVDCDLCDVVDILPTSELRLECNDCNEGAVAPLKRNTRAERTCLRCHTKMAFQAPSIELKTLSPPSAFFFDVVVVV